MSWFSEATEFDISLINPPLYNKYSPATPTIEGRFTVRFLDQLKKVSTIRFGVVGIADVVYHHTDDRRINGKRQVKRRTIRQTHEFFNRYYDVPLPPQNRDIEQSSGISYTFNGGEEVKYELSLDIDKDSYFPSSCNEFGNHTANVSIRYEVYAEVYKYGSVLTFRIKKYSSCHVPILYQSGVNPFERKPANIESLNYHISELFKNKVKKFYFDEHLNALVPSSITKPHSKTRFIRQIWNDNYKSETYHTITKSIPLIVDMMVASAFDLNEPFHTQFALVLFADLASVGIESNQTTDFVFNGQSTNLGLIKIESLKIETINRLHLKCRRHHINEDIKTRLLQINFKNMLFDIKDFSFSMRDNAYRCEMPAESLVRNADVDVNQTFNQIIGNSSIMTSGYIPDWYSNRATFIFTWELSDNGSQRVKYKFETIASPDVLVESDNHNNNNGGSVPNTAYNTTFTYNTTYNTTYDAKDDSDDDSSLLPPPPMYESNIGEMDMKDEKHEKVWDEKN